MGLLPNLVTFFSSYGSYHDNIVNKTIHIFCIPSIVFSLLALFEHLPFKYDCGILEFNLSFISILILSAVYLIIDAQSGLISSVLYFSFHFINQRIYTYSLDHNVTALHFKVALFIQILAWTLQILGHQIFEKRAPALLDNILQIFVAPDFVILEILFHFGYKSKEYSLIKKQIASNIAEYRASLKTKK